MFCLVTFSTAHILKITENVAFEIWHFRQFLTYLVTLFDCKLLGFKNSSKWNIFGISQQLLTARYVNVARFARNVEWDFFCNFQTLWVVSYYRPVLVMIISVPNWWNLDHNSELSKWQETFSSWSAALSTSAGDVPDASSSRASNLTLEGLLTWLLVPIMRKHHY